MEEMQLQKQRLEAESKKEEQSKKQHQDVANAAAAVSNYHKTSISGICLLILFCILAFILLLGFPCYISFMFRFFDSNKLD